MKIKKKLNMEHPYNIEEYESWLSYNAERGLFLKEIGNRFSEFWVGKPEKMKYRVDIVFDKFTGERKSLYEEAGWQYVDCKGKAYIFCAPERVETIEITTDIEEHKKNIKKLEFRQSLYFILFSTILIIEFMLLAYFYFGPNSTPFLNILDPVNVFILIFYFLFFILCISAFIYQFVKIRILKRNISKGKELNHYKKWKTGIKFNGIIEMVVLIAAFSPILFPIINYIRSISDEEINGDSIRIISIMDIEDIEDYNEVHYSEYTKEMTGFLVKEHYYFHEEAKIPGNLNSEFLDVTYYNLYSEFQAKGIYNDSMKYYYDLKYEINEINNEYFDKVQYVNVGNSTIYFIRKDEVVMEITYNGKHNSETIVEKLVNGMELKD